MGQNEFKSVEREIETINQTVLREDLPVESIKKYQEKINDCSTQINCLPKRKQEKPEIKKIKKKIENVKSNLRYKEELKNATNVIPKNIVRNQAKAFTKSTSEDLNKDKYKKQKQACEDALPKQLRSNKATQFPEKQNVSDLRDNSNYMEYKKIKNQFNIIYQQYSDTEMLRELTLLEQKLLKIESFKLKEKIKYLLNNINNHVKVVEYKIEHATTKKNIEFNLLKELEEWINTNKEPSEEILKQLLYKINIKYNLFEKEGNTRNVKDVNKKNKAIKSFLEKNNTDEIDNKSIVEKVKVINSDLRGTIPFENFKQNSNKVNAKNEQSNTKQIIVDNSKSQLEYNFIKKDNAVSKLNTKPQQLENDLIKNKSIVNRKPVLNKINAKTSLCNEQNNRNKTTVDNTINKEENYLVKRRHVVTSVEEKTVVVESKKVNLYNLREIYCKMKKILDSLENKEEKFDITSLEQIQHELEKQEMYLTHLEVASNDDLFRQQILQSINKSFSILHIKKNALRYSTIFKEPLKTKKEDTIQPRVVKVTEINKSNRNFDLKKIHDLDLSLQINTVNQWAHICEENMKQLTKTSSSMEWFIIEENLESFHKHLNKLNCANNVYLSQEKIKVMNYINNLFILIDKQKNLHKKAKNFNSKDGSIGNSLKKKSSADDLEKNCLKQILIVKQSAQQLENKLHESLKISKNLTDYCVLETDLLKLLKNLDKIECNDQPVIFKEKTQLINYIENLKISLNNQKDNFKMTNSKDKNNSSVQIPQILDLGQRFSDFDFKKLNNLSSKIEQINTVRQWAQQLEDKVQHISKLNQPAEVFVLEEKLLSIVDYLDKIMCRNEPETLKKKIDVIDYVNNLLTLLDKPENGQDSNEENSSEQFLEIVDLEHQFSDFDFTKLNDFSRLEQLKCLKQWAQQIEDKIHHFPELNQPIELFVLEEKLSSIIDYLDKIKCRDEPEVLEKKIEVIYYIKSLFKMLDKR